MEAAVPSDARTSTWRRFLAWYLEIPVPDKSLIRWWETRRLAYNLLLLAWAALNFLVGIPVIDARVNSVSAPMVLSTAFYSIGMVAVILQIAANFWYTGGWVAGLIVRWCAHGRAPGFNRYALLSGTLFSFAFSEFWYWLVAIG